MDWSVIYKRAIDENGELFFPERLTQEFLDNARRTMGSWLFSNQYLNEVLPDGAQPFKKEWLRYYQHLPEIKHTFGFIDPAISQDKNADFTGVVIVDVDTDKNWYLRYAQRFKITPTEIISLIFKLHAEFKFNALGIETVAYQKALLYMLDEEMKRRGMIVPVTGIHPGTDKTKETRIMSLIPRFEWSHIFISQGLHDFEIEYSQFPRGVHDDLIDPLSQLEQIVYYPQKPRSKDDTGPHPSDAKYESWYIANIHKRRESEERDPGYGFE